MKECRDIVRELIAMMECGAFQIDARVNDMDFFDYVACCVHALDGGAGYSEITYDGMDFKIDGERLYVQLTSKEDKALNKAFTKAIDAYIINDGDTDGLDEIQAFLQD